MILFELTECEKLAVKLPDGLQDVDCCTEVLIVLIQQQREIVLYDDSLYYGMQSLGTILREALGNHLQVHSSLKNDIGYLYNQYSYHTCMKNSGIEDTFVHEQVATDFFWVGISYHLWGGLDVVSWCYNDNKGNIIFEITPFYQYMYLNADQKPGYVPYQEWIKNYKPYLIKKISRETAQQWINQADAIVAQIDKNIAR